MTVHKRTSRLRVSEIQRRVQRRQDLADVYEPAAKPSSPAVPTRFAITLVFRNGERGPRALFDAADVRAAKARAAEALLSSPTAMGVMLTEDHADHP